jgi:hypothetical protein
VFSFIILTGLAFQKILVTLKSPKQDGSNALWLINYGSEGIGGNSREFFSDF